MTAPGTGAPHEDIYQLRFCPPGQCPPLVWPKDWTAEQAAAWWDDYWRNY